MRDTDRPDRPVSQLEDRDHAAVGEVLRACRGAVKVAWDTGACVGSRRSKPSRAAPSQTARLAPQSQVLGGFSPPRKSKFGGGHVSSAPTFHPSWVGAYVEQAASATTANREPRTMLRRFHAGQTSSIREIPQPRRPRRSERTYRPAGTSVLGSTKAVVFGGCMRRIGTSLALALCLLGCTFGPKMLTGSMGLCGWAGPGPVIEGPLLPDPVAGIAIKVESADSGYSYGLPPIGSIVPVMWPPGFTGHRLSGGEIEVRNNGGEVVATTGNRYRLAPPVAIGGARKYHEGGLWPACAIGAVTEG